MNRIILPPHLEAERLRRDLADARKLLGILSDQYRKLLVHAMALEEDNRRLSRMLAVRIAPKEE